MSAPVRLHQRMIAEMAAAAATSVNGSHNPMLPMMNGAMMGINFSGFASKNNTFGFPHNANTMMNTMMNSPRYMDSETGNGLALSEDLANIARFSNLEACNPLRQTTLT